MKRILAALLFTASCRHADVVRVPECARPTPAQTATAAATPTPALEPTATPTSALEPTATPKPAATPEPRWTPCHTGAAAPRPTCAIDVAPPVPVLVPDEPTPTPEPRPVEPPDWRAVAWVDGTMAALLIIIMMVLLGRKPRR